MKWRLNCERQFHREKKKGGGQEGDAGVKKRYLNTPLRVIPCPSRVTPRCLCFVVSRLVTAETHHERETEGKPVDKSPAETRRSGMSTQKTRMQSLRVFLEDARYFIRKNL